MAKGAGLARLVRLEDIEVFRQYNTFIHSGYRVDFRWRDALGSLWYRHNELWNVWTHLGGAAFFVAVTLHSYATWLSDGVWEDWLFYLPYALASVYCCTASSFFHLTDCLGEGWYQLGVRLDYTGIVSLIVGSYVTMLHYLFPCSLPSKLAWALGETGVGGLALYLSLSPTFQRPQFAGLRAGLFILTSLVGVFCAPHFLYQYAALDVDVADLLPGFLLLLSMGAMYILGAGFYAAKVPERWWPGRFDLAFMQSHVIFHLFVCAGTFTTYLSCRWFHAWRISSGFSCPTVA